MEDKDKKVLEQTTTKPDSPDESRPLDEDWALNAKYDLEDFIEEQGIYIRQ